MQYRQRSWGVGGSNVNIWGETSPAISVVRWSIFFWLHNIIKMQISLIVAIFVYYAEWNQKMLICTNIHQELLSFGTHIDIVSIEYEETLTLK